MFRFSRVLPVLLLGASATVGSSQAAIYTLYDAAAGSLPSGQGWTTVLPSGASQSLGGDGVTFTSIASNGLQGGYSRFGGSLPMALDSSLGFTLSFDLQLLAENHASANRAGVSLILLDSQHKGVELGFWNGSVWAQAVGFSRAESVAFDTLGGLSHFDLTFSASGYHLSAARAGQSTVSLNGSLRNYGSPFLPYGLSNFIYFGDDTTSAAGSFLLDNVQLSTVPEPASSLLFSLGVGLLAGASRFSGRRRTA